MNKDIKLHLGKKWTSMMRSLERKLAVLIQTDICDSTLSCVYIETDSSSAEPNSSLWNTSRFPAKSSKGERKTARPGKDARLESQGYMKQHMIRVWT